MGRTDGLGVYIPTEREKYAVYSDYISKIYSILIRYEENQKVDREYINFLCFEIQAYANVINSKELDGLAGKLILLTNEDITHTFLRKIVFDCTNFLTRLMQKGGK